MCTRPFRLKTRKLDFCPECDPLYYTVPCGHCKECVSRKRSSWAVRAYYEFQRVKKDGVCLFVTFTYNDDNLPYMADPVTGELYPCFSKKHVQTFLHALRKRLKRMYNDTYTIRYLWCSEFGGDTKRPHYHALLFISKKPNIFWFRNQMRELWKYGFIYLGKNQGIVNGYAAINYVTKYIAKDIDFMAQFPKRKEMIASMGKEEFNELSRECFPFHLISKGFGSNIIDEVPFNLLLLGVVPMPSKKGMVNVPIPQYIDRKVFYDTDANYRYVLNQQGVQMRLIRYPQMFQGVKEGIQTLLDFCQTSTDNYFWQTALDHYNTIVDQDKVLVTNKFTELVKCYISDVLKIDVLDEFTDYLINKRYYMYSYDGGFPEPTKVIENSYEAHITKQADPFIKEWSQCSKYYHVVERRKTFIDACTLLEKNLSDYEDFAVLVDSLRFAYGQILYDAYLATLEEEKQAKTLKHKTYKYGNK